MGKEKLYIAYGSNMNLEQMAVRCPTAKVVGVSEIKDYELVFRGSKSGFYATIEPCIGQKVPVLIWSIKEQDEKNLDRYEGYPNFYDKKEILLNLNGNEISAMVYTMPTEHSLGLPSPYYVRTIEKGYESADIDTDILYDAIDKTEDRMSIAPRQTTLFDFRW
ncbi:MAG: gamma-glutamylcyclotransferase family protein [Clostridia bacterium]